MSVRRTVAAAMLACAAGFAAAHAATDGFAAFTLESARRLEALSSPRPVPDLAFDASEGSRTSVHAIPEGVLLVDFIYTRCETLCAALGSVYARLQAMLADEIAAGSVRLVSVSFDPQHDSDARLNAYRARHGGSPEGWALGRPAREPDLERWLDAFGVVVIPDGWGGYTHNAAVHVLDAERRLVGIYDLADLDGIARAARSLATGGRRDVAAR